MLRICSWKRGWNTQEPEHSISTVLCTTYILEMSSLSPPSFHRGYTPEVPTEKKIVINQLCSHKCQW